MLQKIFALLTGTVALYVLVTIVLMATGSSSPLLGAILISMFFLLVLDTAFLWEIKDKIDIYEKKKKKENEGQM